MRLFLAAIALLAAFPARAVLPGDTAADPLPVPSLPFFDAGTTCSYEDDYDEFCPIDGQLSPDVVYAFTPAADVEVNLSLCESRYDTKILVYENGDSHSDLYACNDDWCDGPYYEWPYLAYLRKLPLAAGNTYYFVVDGYGSSCGLYALRITESESCPFECPGGAIQEPELPCVDGAADSVNAGCASDPPLFVTVPPSPEPIEICGITHAEAGQLERDEDWYEILPSEPDTITVQGKGDIALFVTVFDGTPGCEEAPVLGYGMTEPCEKTGVTLAVGAGPLWIRVRPVLAWDVTCPGNYILTIRGYEGSVTAIPPPAAAPRVDPLLLAVAPNPFLRTARVRSAAVPPGAWLTLRVYDAAGRVVRTLHEGAAGSGSVETTWDGRDDAGVRVAGGTYFVRLSAGSSGRTKKVVFLGGPR